jgi:guanosine-3',5'-bis(diphosphate) 3'-pyrophosphohydrolase
MDKVLQKVYDFARAAHAGQQRKFVNEPYIEHPLRVMKICEEYTQDPAILAAALLHDVLEDTVISDEEIDKSLRKVMPVEKAKRSLNYVLDLTDVFNKKNHPKWNRRKRKQKEMDRLALASPEAQTIKYADIIDNSLDIIHAETDFKHKYLLECRSLLRRMKKGIPELARRAQETVEQCIISLSDRGNKGEIAPG